MTADPAGLQSLLAGEHAAVNAYAVAGAALVRLNTDPALLGVVRSGYDVHRQTRDDLADAIAALGGSPPEPSPAYQLPFALDDAGAVLRLLVLVEDRLAAIAASAVRTEAGRRASASVLSAAAVRAAELRRLQLLPPGRVLTAFPGLQPPA